MDKSPRQNRIREALDRIYDQHPPQIREYVRRYQQDPKSRVFAPLAEAYRRLGRVDEALGLCLEGLSHHPEFHGGRVALAKCYLDKHQFDQAREQLEKVIQKVPDNLLAQRLLGDTWLALGQPHQALHCYKMALILSPNDVQLEEKMRSIDLERKNGFVVSAPEKSICTMPVPPAGEMPPRNLDLWTVDADSHSNESEPSRSTEAFTESLWSKEVIPEPVADSSAIESSLNLGGEIEIEETFQVQNVRELFKEKEHCSEITTSTLADLYFSQGQFEKSLLMYERLLESDPLNVQLKKRIAQCQSHLGVNKETIERNRKIDALREILSRVYGGCHSV